jgi:hypothetical protein
MGRSGCRQVVVPVSVQRGGGSLQLFSECKAPIEVRATNKLKTRIKKYFYLNEYSRVWPVTQDLQSHNLINTFYVQKVIEFCISTLFETRTRSPTSR